MKAWIKRFTKEQSKLTGLTLTKPSTADNILPKRMCYKAWTYIPKNLTSEGKLTYLMQTAGFLQSEKKINKIYDGYIFQLYAQYYALVEMGYCVKKIRFHSMRDNKNYNIKLPSEDTEMNQKFKNVIKSIKEFNMETFQQTNVKKCKNCIYEPACDRSLYAD